MAFQCHISDLTIFIEYISMIGEYYMVHRVKTRIKMLIIKKKAPDLLRYKYNELDYLLSKLITAVIFY
jgi:hypothetical protein